MEVRPNHKKKNMQPPIGKIDRGETQRQLREISAKLAKLELRNGDKDEIANLYTIKARLIASLNIYE